jgi:hypothetical protein
MIADIPTQGVYRDHRSGDHLVVVVLTPDEADAFADLLGSSDRGARDFYDWAAEARRKDEDR